MKVGRLGAGLAVVVAGVVGGAASAEPKVLSLLDAARRAEPRIVSLADGATRTQGEPVVRRVDCTPPGPSPEARVIGFWAPGATQFRTDVTMFRSGGPTHESTWSIRVEIEEGEEPLYLGLTSDLSVIWDFQGDVDRIEQVILAGHSLGLGTEGVPAERVAVLDGTCYTGTPRWAYFLTSGEALVDGPGLFEAAAGREVELVSVSGPVDLLRLPSGETWRAAQRGLGYSPLQIHEVDLGSLVTTRLAARPEILPGMAGVQQLVARGDLVERAGEVERYTVVSQLDRLPNARVGYHLAEGIMPPARQVYPVCLFGPDGTWLSAHEGAACGSGRLARRLEPPEEMWFRR